jgi:methyltransferase (TIGR00027 family)
MAQFLGTPPASMRNRASCSAKMVAAARGVGVFLPPGLCALAPDPYGIALAGAPYTALAAAMHRWPRVAAWAMSSGPLHRVALGMALRTRELDDILRRFCASGGRQVVLLGAGLDARPWRLREELPRDLRWFAVDHPATQAATLNVLAPALAPLAKAGDVHPEVRWVAHDFEQPMPALRAALLQAGLDTSARVLVVWEGGAWFSLVWIAQLPFPCSDQLAIHSCFTPPVVMYLSEQALDASVALVRSISCPGSVLAFNYIPPESMSAPPATTWRYGTRRLASWLACLLWPWRLLTCLFSVQFWIFLLLRVCDEPLRFIGWRRGELPGWLASRGFRLLSDRTYADVADALGAPPDTLAMLGDGRFVAVAERFVEAHRTADADGPAIAP